jgi:hypothetical protein
LKKIADRKECLSCSHYRKNPNNPPETKVRLKICGGRQTKIRILRLKHNLRAIETILLALMAPTNPSL